jgi:hypothetical protein
MEKKHRIYSMSFASVYPLYVQKAEKKGRTKAEVDEVIAWLTGYAGAQLQRVIDDKTDLEAFFASAPRMNPNVGLIKGVVCGVRVEDVADPLMRNIRYLDKLIDELARGKKMESILRVDGAGERKIGLNEVVIGLTIPFYGIEVARHRLSAPWFQHATVTGALYAPEAALAAGFFDRVVAPEELADATRAEAARLAALKMDAHAGTKMRVREAALRAIREGIDREFPAV